jgi:amino acid adenylation domain-containing protein
MKEDIAIIGMSGIFPEAADIGEFYQNLCSGRDSVRPIPADRIRYSRLKGDNYQISGVLDRIDLFDHQYFQIAKAEADVMDPHQRISLQLACAAIENAGYAVSRLAGADTGICMAAPNGGYSELFSSFSFLKLTGVLPSNLVGRLSQALDLRGPAHVVDTSCSSSMTAIIHACNELLLGNANYMLAGGVNLNVDFLSKGNNAMLINSSDGRCRSFSKDAEGTGWGEGGGILLLKRYRQAIEDKDNIQAVIRGYATGQNGRLSVGISTPSTEAQSNTIEKAMRKAVILPEEIGYVEAHGSSTVIGDSIEIQGLNDAFSKQTAKRNYCAIGSVKTNIGHLNVAAGVVAVIKAVLSVKYKKKFPSLHFSEPNPHIEFDRSPFYVNTRLQDWNEEKRVVSVSSIGINGSNSHMVVQSAPSMHGGAFGGASTGEGSDAKPSSGMIKISAKSERSLKMGMDRLAAYLENTGDRLPDISRTLNEGRDDHGFRAVFFGQSAKQVAGEMRRVLAGISGPVYFNREKPVYLLLSPDGKPGSSRTEIFAFHLAFCRRLLSAGIEIAEILTAGFCSLVAAVLLEEMPLDEALLQLEMFSDDQPAFDADKFSVYLEKEMTGKSLVLLSSTERGILPDTVRLLKENKDTIELIRPKGSDDEGSFIYLVGELYCAGVTVNWAKYYENSEARRLEAPGYCFDPVSCWEHDSEESSPAVAGPAWTSANIPQRLKEIISVVLSDPSLEAEDDLFLKGLHSLLAMQIVNRIREESGLEIGIDVLFEYNTIAKLSGYVGRLYGDGQQPELKNIEPLAGQPHYELSHAQRRLWILDQLEEGQVAYNMPGRYRFTGQLDRLALEKAIAAVVVRHEVFRTKFIVVDGEPRQQIDDAERMVFRLDYRDLRGFPDRQLQAATICRKDAVLPFDLQRGGLLRACLLQLEEDEYIFLFTLHHIISDQWSMDVLVGEITQLYKAFREGNVYPLPPLKIQYKDYAGWQRRELEESVIGSHRDYWLSRFDGELPVLELPADRPRPAVKTYKGEGYALNLGKESEQRLSLLAREQSASLFMALTATVLTLLHRYTGQQDIVVGTPIAGRDKQELEDQIGFYVNTLALRNSVDSKWNFIQLLNHVTRNTLDAFRHQLYPFDQLVDELRMTRNGSRSPLFDVMVVLQSAHKRTAAPEMEGVAVEEYTEGSAKISKFDLTFNFMHNESGLGLYVEYNTDLFDKVWIGRLLDHYQGLVASIIDNPSIAIGDLEYISDRATENSAADGQGLVYDRSLSTIVELFEEQVERTPANVAVKFGTQELTYRELNEKCNRITSCLKDRKLVLRSGQPVGILMSRGIDLVIGILAILKAGGVYVPVDPDYPPERVRFMLEDANAELVLTDRPGAESIYELKTCQVLCIGGQSFEEGAAENPIPAGKAEDLAYIIYTSGSTGRPKGVMVSHGNVVSLLRSCMDQMEIGEKDTWSLFHSVCFDFSVWEIFGCLTTGGRLLIVSRPICRDAESFARLVEEEGVTVLNQVPGMFVNVQEYLFDQIGQGPLALRYVIFGGESLNPALLSSWFTRYPEVRLINMYGITETTVHVTLKQIGASEIAAGRSNIGKPLSNARVYIMDSRGRQKPSGTIGEIVVGGAGVSKGYLNRPELSQEKFMDDPFRPGEKLYCSGDLGIMTEEGEIIYKGRKDYQVKIRGHRIELGEIERCLVKHKAVSEAIVTSREMPGNIHRLVAYFTGSGHLTMLQLRNHLLTELPSYMLPEVFIRLDQFPLTGNGKIDRATLPEPEGPGIDMGTTYEYPRNETERKLVMIWQEILGRERIGITDNFFETGGNSLLVIRLVGRIKELFGEKIRVVDVYNCTTIKEQAVLIDGEQIEQLSSTNQFEEFEL